jgi:DNA-binding NtrC family response regulator
MGDHTWTDDFLAHVFPGTSSIMDSFRESIGRLNAYCRRYKEAIRSVLVTGPPGSGKNYTVRAVSAHSAWLTCTDDEKRELHYCDSRGRMLLPAEQLIDRLLAKEHRPAPRKPPVRVSRLATVLVPQLTENLIASELFGHKDGAFTGATKARPGIFGDDSTEDILLDEFAELPPPLQAQLLHVIETGRIPSRRRPCRR